MLKRDDSIDIQVQGINQLEDFFLNNDSDH